MPGAGDSVRVEGVVAVAGVAGSAGADDDLDELGVVDETAGNSRLRVLVGAEGVAAPERKEIERVDCADSDSSAGPVDGALSALLRPGAAQRAGGAGKRFGLAPRNDQSI